MASVGLISCVSRKRAHATVARGLYDSPLFTKARDYIEHRCNRWYILSAKYGLVLPSQVIEPYEETLNTKSRAERERWAARVWKQLRPHLSFDDEVVILAGERYRQFLLPRITEYGCAVDVPMEGKSIGSQLRWLSQQLRQPSRERDLEQLYDSLKRLEKGLGGKRLLSACSGQQDWPKSGVYVFFEPRECRRGRIEPRVVRVGTHGVSRGSRATLWNRLRTHRGTGDGHGNHRSSIFRLHVGAALAARDQRLAVPSWSIGQAADAGIRKDEQALERAVSQHIGAMSILWIAVEDEPSPASDRAYLERNLIGLLVGRTGPIDIPSHDWLGLSSPDERIRNSGLWNLDFLDYPYSSGFVDVLDEYVSVTIGEKRPPPKSIAPRDWYRNDRQRVPRNQLSLFGD